MRETRTLCSDGQTWVRLRVRVRVRLRVRVRNRVRDRDRVSPNPNPNLNPNQESSPESLLRALMATLSAVSGDGDAGVPSPYKAEAEGTDPELEVSICDATPSATTTVFQ